MDNEFYDLWAKTYGLMRRRWLFGMIVESNRRLRNRILVAMSDKWSL